LDVRDVDSDRQRELTETLLDDAFKIAARREIAITAELLSDQSPVLLHRSVRQRLATAAASLNVPFCVLRSGATHDAAQVAQVSQAGMVFIPCKGGISHAPAEAASYTDIARGAELIAEAFESTVALAPSDAESM
jgi:acetylornithine deacetylase/succinyl-diaminopimelate desuccinylase-like protein